MKAFTKKVLFPILFFTCAFLILLRFASNPKNDAADYTLKSYKNTVALYDGQEIIEIYSEIVLNTLPEKDIQIFEKGISFSSPSQAENYLLDFE